MKVSGDYWLFHGEERAKKMAKVISEALVRIDRIEATLSELLR